MGTANGETSETGWRAYNNCVSCKKHHNISIFLTFSELKKKMLCFGRSMSVLEVLLTKYLCLSNVFSSYLSFTYSNTTETLLPVFTLLSLTVQVRECSGSIGV